MDIILGPIIEIAIEIIWFYTWVVIAAAIMSWLVAFGVVNTYNRFVHTLNDLLYRITEPALRPLRRFIPNLGGVDITPVVLIFILWLITKILIRIQFTYG
jgi:YggT family protein